MFKKWLVFLFFIVELLFTTIMIGYCQEIQLKNGTVRIEVYGPCSESIKNIIISSKVMNDAPFFYLNNGAKNKIIVHTMIKECNKNGVNVKFDNNFFSTNNFSTDNFKIKIIMNVIAIYENGNSVGLGETEGILYRSNKNSLNFKSGNFGVHMDSETKSSLECEDLAQKIKEFYIPPPPFTLWYESLPFEVNEGDIKKIFINGEEVGLGQIINIKIENTKYYLKIKMVEIYKKFTIKDIITKTVDIDDIK